MKPGVPALLFFSLVMAGCGAAPSATPASPGATAPGPASPSPAGPGASGGSGGAAAATAEPGDAAAARSLAVRFLSAFVAEDWSTAYGLLAPQSQQDWGGSVSAFAANWPHPAKDTGGVYTIEDQVNDPEQAATLAGSAPSGAILSRSFFFDVSFPNPSGAVPGPYMTLLAAPDAAGAWRLWRLR